jgi:four helix bundle protein
MQNFAAYQIAIQLAAALKPIIQELRRHSSEAANQVERACISIVLNIGEGNRRSGKDPIRFFTMASGSTSEVLAALDLARALDWPVKDDEARRLLDRQRALLWGLTHPKRSRSAA